MRSVAASYSFGLAFISDRVVNGGWSKGSRHNIVDGAALKPKMSIFFSKRAAYPKTIHCSRLL